MARVKLSALFTAIRGKYAGGVFRDWNGRTTLAASQSSLKNYYTEHQVKYRAVLGVCSKSWSLLSFKERDAWEAVAAYLTEQWYNFENEVGSRSVIRVPRGPFTGIDALISVHSLLFSCNLWFPHQHLRSAPIGVTAPSPPTDLFFFADPDRLFLSWVHPSTWGTNANPGSTRLWLKSENGNFYPQFFKYRSPPGHADYIFNLRVEGSGGYIPITDGVYFAQLDAVNNEGLRSPPSEIIQIRFIRA